MSPGSHTPQQAALGFHLATCAACRTYRTALQQRLLSALLGPATTTAPSVAPRTTSLPTLVPESTEPAPRRSSLRHIVTQTLWYAGLGLLATFGLLTLIVIGSVARTAFHIHQNVQAMIVATEPPTSTIAPATPTMPTPAPTSAALHTLPTMLPTLTPPPTEAPTASPTATAPIAGTAVNVLLLGIDQRPDETTPARTDAILIARIDPQNHRVALLSLPRDLVVQIPGFGRSRINNANVFGARSGIPNGGAKLASQTVSNLLHIPIDYYVLIDFQGFINAIDTLGGIDVDIQRELYDGRFPTMDYGYMVAHFLPGPQHLDGATALVFSRIRHSDSDFARIQRQQQVILGVVGQLRTNSINERLNDLEAVTGALRGYVKTNMSEERIIGLAWALRDLSPDQIERYALRADQVTFGIGSDRWAEVAKPGAIEDLAAHLMGEQ